MMETRVGGRTFIVFDSMSQRLRTYIQSVLVSWRIFCSNATFEPGEISEDEPLVHGIQNTLHLVPVTLRKFKSGPICRKPITTMSLFTLLFFHSGFTERSDTFSWISGACLVTHSCRQKRTEINQFNKEYNNDCIDVHVSNI